MAAEAILPTSARREPAPWLTWTALGVVYIGWGSTYLAIRVMVETVPPLLGAGARFFLAGTLLLGWVAARHPAAIRVRGRELASLALVGTLLLAGGNGLVTLGERHVPSGLAALLIASVPLWLVVMRTVTGDRPPRAALAGVVLGFAGVALLLLPGARPAGVTAAGLATLLLAAVSWASGSFVAGRLPLPRSVFVSTAIEMLCGGAVLLVAGLAAGEAGRLDLGHVSAGSAWGFAFLVIAGSLVTFSAYVWLLANAPLGRVATYAFVNPLVAVTLGAVILGEHLTGTVALAAAIIVAAVALVVRRDRAG